MSLIQREDLRLAISIGLAAGLGSLSSVPDGYYMPLTIAAVMAGSYGSSYVLGLQRVVCTGLGAIVLLICQPALALLPFPFGLGLTLGLIRLIGGLLGLQAGYKIAGLVVIMGWTMQSTAAIDSWLGLKIIWTALGVLLALLSLHLFWPNTAIRDHHRNVQSLLAMQREALLQARVLMTGSTEIWLQPSERKQMHRQLMHALVELKKSRPAAIVELGVNPYGQPLAHLWHELERCCAALAGCITALRALREFQEFSAEIEILHCQEAALLAGCIDQLGDWIARLKANPLQLYSIQL
ncbi:FUSC family protein [Cyanobium sp. HWJ4-Hawea]|uniref:FUSC family protein n=1 Tax=Cyanobium sp. HWJ4-Hawea TaxID=2823713 RepID=UPI0020CCCF8C|nr:FUSC family protein [Cyanobium sp. HWJ4-Hawea]MCP9809583.1 FUSC family protein [Cyanobium sp. HWJ4-Hawea]